MSIKINGRDLSKRMINGREVIKVMKNGVQVRPSAVPPVFDNYLCFTANTSGSTVKLIAGHGTPDPVQLEISRDKNTWTSYTIGDTITLTNVWDKVYFRNTSSITTGFSKSNWYYNFVMSGSIAGSGNVTTLIRNEGSDYTVWACCFIYLFVNCTALTSAPELPSHILTQECYYEMFMGCTSLVTAPELPATNLQPDCYGGMFRRCSSLTTAPSLPATTLASFCYERMFGECTSLTTIPSLPATSLSNYCYKSMFEWCTNIKISTTQDSTYINEYRIPTLWTGTVGTNSLTDMFKNTWWDVTTPSINTTYYTSNTIV